MAYNNNNNNNTVDAKGLHGLSSKGGSGRSVRHHALNDLIWRALSKADIPATKEPSGLLKTDGSDPTASHFCHGRMEDVPHGTSL